jgi:hypothetical protein
MQKIKIFKTTEYKVAELERTVNQWIASEDVRVLQITGNLGAQTGGGDTDADFEASDVMLVVLYETKE